MSRRVPGLKGLPDPMIVKAQIPRSMFTKSGPGRTAQLCEALRRFSQPQREIAMAKGWDKGLLRRTRQGKLRLK
jgi:hypothetical protein